jgi:hypothetical protein
MVSKRKKYTQEYKAEAVELVGQRFRTSSNWRMGLPCSGDSLLEVADRLSTSTARELDP